MHWFSFIFNFHSVLDWLNSVETIVFLTLLFVKKLLTFLSTWHVSWSYKWSEFLSLFFWFVFNWGINYDHLNEAFLCVCVCACMFYLRKDINLEILVNYADLYDSYLTKMNYSLSRIKRKYWSRSGISSQKLLPLYHSTIENKSMFLSDSQAFSIFCILSRLQGS